MKCSLEKRNQAKSFAVNHASCSNPNMPTRCSRGCKVHALLYVKEPYESHEIVIHVPNAETYQEKRLGNVYGSQT